MRLLGRLVQLIGIGLENTWRDGGSGAALGRRGRYEDSNGGEALTEWSANSSFWTPDWTRI